MEETYSLLRALLTGLVFGFLGCIPVGPINVTILNEGANRGLWWALMIGAGAMAMDIVYFAIAFAGFTQLFDSNVFRLTIEFISFLLMLILGWKYLRAQELPRTTHPVEDIEQRFHPHTAFMIGFVRVLANPAVLLYWLAMSTNFISHGLVTNDLRAKSVCGLGNFIGGMIWFLILSFTVSRGHGKFSNKTLLRMAHFSGLSLLLTAAYFGYRLCRTLGQPD